MILQSMHKHLFGVRRLKMCLGIVSHYYNILKRADHDNRVDVLQGSGNIFERGMLDRLEKHHFFGKGFLLNKVFAAGILPSFFSASYLLLGTLIYSISTVLVGLGTKEQIDTAMREDIPMLARPKFSDVLLRLGKIFLPIECDRCQRCICFYGAEIHTIFRQYHYYFLGKEYWALRKLSLNIH